MKQKDCKKRESCFPSLLFAFIAENEKAIETTLKTLSFAEEEIEKRDDDASRHAYFRRGKAGVVLSLRYKKNNLGP